MHDYSSKNLNTLSVGIGMSDLTINSVFFKKQVYPMILNFQNGYPSENFEFGCALIQDEDGNKAVATEFNRLLYAGYEETEDLGQTFLLARNRKTGKVRLIEAGSASLKPFIEYEPKYERELENSIVEPDKPNYPQHRNTSRRNHTPEKETNYEHVKKQSQVLEPSELELNILAHDRQQPQSSELEPKGANSLLSGHNEVEPNRSNHLQSLETSESGPKSSLLLEPSEIKLKTKELNLNTLNDDKDFSTAKKMFVTALGLDVKVSETVYSENNVHSSPVNNNKQKIYVVQNAPYDDFIIVSLERRTYFCGYCNKTFEDKGSTIFHLISHKFIMNAKNAVPKPLAKMMVGNINSNDNIFTKKRRYNDRSEKKINLSNTSDKTKVINNNVLKHCDNDDDAIYEGVKVHGNNSVIIQDTPNMQILHKKIKITENFNDFSDDSPVDVAEENFVLNHPSVTERSLTCDHCDKTFQDKESLYFHLLTDKLINEMPIVQASAIIMTNSETNEDNNEHEERNSNDMTKHTRVMTRRMHLVAQKSIDDINIRESRIITTENEPTQGSNEIETLLVHSPNRQPKVNCEDDEVEINITTDSSVRNNTEQTVRVVVKMNEQRKISNKKSTAVDNTFTCNECGRKLKHKRSLITHITCHNSSIKANKKVKLKFPHKLGVKEHNKNSNPEAKEEITLKLPLKDASGKVYKLCTLCKYKTPYASRLTRHKRVHTKAFKCKHCEKGFRKSNDLKVHLRCHTGDKPFQCRCGATFAKKNSLDRHLTTHSEEKDFKCTLCTSKFKHLSALTRHLKIHGEKTYKCTSCESSFRDGSSMKRHMRRHTGQKPYGCDSCKYSSAYSHDLKKHAKTCQGRC